MESNTSGAAYDAAQALSDVNSSREAAAARFRTPAWYHPLLAANVAFLTLLVAQRPEFPWFLAGCALSIAISLGLALAYKRITGLWIGPAEVGPRGRALWITYALVLAAVLVAAFFVDANGLDRLYALALGGIGFGATWMTGLRLDDTVREEIRAGVMPAPSGAR